MLNLLSNERITVHCIYIREYFFFSHKQMMSQLFHYVIVKCFKIFIYSFNQHLLDAYNMLTYLAEMHQHTKQNTLPSWNLHSGKGERQRRIDLINK